MNMPTTPKSSVNSSKIYIQQGQIWMAPRLRGKDPKQAILLKESARISCTLYPTDSLKSFEDVLRKELSDIGAFHVAKFQFDSVWLFLVSLIFPILIAFAIGILAAYGTTFTDILTGNPIKEVFIATALFVIIGISAFPSILFSASDGMVKKSVQDWYHKDARVRRRIKYALSTLIKTTGIKSIILWNPCAQSDNSWIWKALVPAIVDQNKISELVITFHIKNDERDEVLNRLRNIDKTIDVGDSKKMRTENQDQCDTNYEKVLNLLNEHENNLLEILLILSTYSIPYKWENVSELTKMGGLISLELTSIIINPSSGNTVSAMEVVDGKYLYPFFRRCVDDYNLVTPFIEGGEKYWKLIEEVPKIIDFKKIRHRHQYINNYIETECSELSRCISDPAGLLIVYMFLVNNDSGIKAKINILISMIEQMSKAESYFLMDYFKAIKKDFAQNPDSELPDKKFLSAFPIHTLQNFTTLMERSGDFDFAIQITDFLHPINPNIFDLTKARLLERRGKYDESLKILDKIIGNYNINNNYLDTAIDFECKLYLLASWVIVSGGLSKRKEDGRNYLKNASSIIEKYSRNKKNCDPLLLWHLHNNSAQYYEWEAAYDDSINSHQICLKLPGIEYKWISGTNVNLGIAYREKFFTNKDQMTLLDNAIKYGEEGVQIKMELGDKDELPVALHNLALSQLLRFKHDGKNSAYLNNAFNNILKGLELLEASGSIKKRGQLLAEKYISSQLKVNADWKSTKNRESEELKEWREISPPPNPGDIATVDKILGYFE